MSLVDDFDELTKVKEKIKIFHVFNNRATSSPYRLDKENKNHIYVTEDDEVYVFGPNSMSCLISGKTDLGQTKVFKLCKKRIYKFVNGAYHVFALAEGDNIYCWGLNCFGQLGNNSFEFDGQLHSENLSGKKLKDICCGDWHSLALAEDGCVYAWGDDRFGQIGVNEKDNSSVMRPTLVKFKEGDKIISISCGSMHSMALTEDGGVYSWGFNQFGQLGLGDNVNRNAPQLIPVGKIMEKIVKICCGQKTSYCLSEDGGVYVFGKRYTERGKLNQKSPIRLTSEVKFEDIFSNISYSFAIAIAENVVYEFGKCKNYKEKKKEMTMKGIESDFSPTIYKSFYQYFVKERKITFESINVTNLRLKLKFI